MLFELDLEMACRGLANPALPIIFSLISLDDVELVVSIDDRFDIIVETLL